MPNIFGNLPGIKDILNWFKDYYNTPEGKRALIVIVSSLAFGFYYGSIRYDDGMQFQQKQDSITIAEKKEDIASLKKDKIKLEKKNSEQQKKLENRDCVDEVMNYRKLFEDLQIKTAQSTDAVVAQKNMEVQERKQAEIILKANQRKTQELLTIKNNLK